MRCTIAALLLLMSTGIMAEQPNGNHYGNGYLNDKSDNGKKTLSVSEPGALALVGLGLVGLVVAQIKKK